MGTFGIRFSSLMSHLDKHSTKVDAPNTDHVPYSVEMCSSSTFHCRNVALEDMTYFFGPKNRSSTLKLHLCPEMYD